ncbi:MAG: H+transporting two-sector ATPase C subunit [Burkholderiaceae bacterium]|nr:H+transporting two-sector ATPase C subunit [Burkholderiaceae bacterium]
MPLPVPAGTRRAAPLVLLVIALAIVGTAVALMFALPASAQIAVAPTAGATDPSVLRWAFAAAAAAAGLATLAAGYAVAVVGSAAVGALAEKPELLGRVLILVGLAEGIAIYGLIVAILILNRT